LGKHDRGAEYRPIAAGGACPIGHIHAFRTSLYTVVNQVCTKAVPLCGNTQISSGGLLMSALGHVME